MNKGDRGISGERGPKGDHGQEGHDGIQGEQGIQGIQGAAGRGVAAMFIVLMMATVFIGYVVSSNATRDVEQAVEDRRVALIRGCERNVTANTRHARVWSRAATTWYDDALRDGRKITMDTAVEYAATSKVFASLVIDCQKSYPEVGEGVDVLDTRRVAREVPPLPAPLR